MIYRGVSLETDDSILMMALVLRDPIDVSEFLQAMNNAFPGKVLEKIVNLAQDVRLQNTPVYNAAVESYSVLTTADLDQMKQTYMFSSESERLISCNVVIELLETIESLRKLVKDGITLIEHTLSEKDGAEFASWLMQASSATNR